MNKGFSEEKKMAVKIFGSRLTELMKKKKLSAYELSKQINNFNAKNPNKAVSGCNDNLISTKWQRGIYRPNELTIIVLAELLDSTADFLLLSEQTIKDTIQKIKLAYWKSGKTFVNEDEFCKWISSVFGFTMEESKVYVQSWILQRLISGKSSYDKDKEKTREKEFAEYEKKYQAFAESVPNCLFEASEGIEKNKDRFNTYLRFCIDSITRYYFGEITRKDLEERITKEYFFTNEVPSSLIQAWEDEVKYGKYN